MYPVFNGVYQLFGYQKYEATLMITEYQLSICDPGLQNQSQESKKNK